MGKVVQPPQSINCHDSHAHGHQRHGPLTHLVRVWLGWFWMGLSRSSWFGLWYAAGVKPLCMVLGFGYRLDACECWSVLATGVTPVNLCP